jgi:serine/threonine protein phosphatase 1
MSLFAKPQRPRLRFESRPAAIYAIGDVHGCLDQLIALEAQIVADAAAIAGEKWLVTLGDYVDRGPQPAAVIDRMMGPAPAGFRRFSLIGNHEQLLLDFLDNPPAALDWLEWGGMATAASYGLRDDGSASWRVRPDDFARRLRPLIPDAHLDWLQNLPTCLAVPGFLFVHAGIRPGIPLAAQDDQDLIWIRAPFLNARLPGEPTIVHGHTPVEVPEFVTGRIDIDTGCCFRGTLTALRILADGSLKVLQARGAPSDYVPVNRR